ncbi:MAG: OB-fold nucleic acid binding domain-containing protein, partial [Oscillospiraceae bacterium]|nr:OB-fold nucleic acid binding domain-containing protein [Oscillospiraceae bacterium]
MSDENINSGDIDLENINEQMKIRREKLAELIKSGKSPFNIRKFATDSSASEITGNFDSLEGTGVKIAGRIMTRRNMGKANFINIADFTGGIQIYVRMNDIGEEAFAEFKTWDIGDIIGVDGKVFKTKTGEISVHASSVMLLAKSLIPLPEKFHGLKDIELRYRQRYLDLIMNGGIKNIFIKRSEIVKHMRGFLDAEGFIEVETPVLQGVAGGAPARPFKTHHNALGIDLKLRISLELPLKRLIVGGFEKVYEIGRVFRNEGMSTR